MSDKLKDKVVIEALLERFQKQRLARILDIKDKVDLGNKLDKYDLEFLEEVFNDTRENEHYIEVADDEFKMICSKVISLYKEITLKALAKEQNSEPY